MTISIKIACQLAVIALIGIGVIIMFCLACGWLVSLVQVDPAKCGDYPKYRYENKTAPIKCYKEYKGVN